MSGIQRAEQKARSRQQTRSAVGTSRVCTRDFLLGVGQSVLLRCGGMSLRKLQIRTNHEPLEEFLSCVLFLSVVPVLRRILIDKDPEEDSGQAPIKKRSG